MTTHTERQVQEALALLRLPTPKLRAEFEKQLRADQPSAWFVVAHKKARA